MPAKNFKKYDARVRRFSPGFIGVTTIYRDVENAGEVALFAPDADQLERVWNRICDEPLDRKRLQKVIYFQQKSISEKRKPATLPPKRPRSRRRGDQT